MLLSAGGKVTIQETIALIDLFIFWFILADETAITLYSILRIILQFGDLLPSSYPYVRQVKNPAILFTLSIPSNANSTTHILSIRYQLQDVQSNLTEIA